MPFQVTYERTPNPQSLKFVISRPISNEALEFTERDQAQRSPLAEKILGFPWAQRVFLGKDFVTVTKEDWLEWDMICDPLSDLIREHLNRGELVLRPKENKAKKEPPTIPDSLEAQKIKEILERDIQPAVALDGGQIEFVSYKEGIVFLRLKGACSGCPSSTFTLKQGIETRLRQFVPEIKGVEPC